MTCRPTVCVTCVWAGVDSAWEQKKLEARKILENAAESHTSGARFVRHVLLISLFFVLRHQTDVFFRSCEYILQSFLFLKELIRFLFQLVHYRLSICNEQNNSLYTSFCQHRPICRISGPDKQYSCLRIRTATTANANHRQKLLNSNHCFTPVAVKTLHAEFPADRTLSVAEDSPSSVV